MYITYLGRRAAKCVVHTQEFVSGLGRLSWGVTSLTVDLEDKVDPIVFTGANYQTNTQGYAWPRG